VSAPAEVLVLPRHSAAPAAPSLQVNAAWNLAGNVFYAACQWAFISILAKTGGARPVGEFALGLSIGAPVFMLGNLHLRAIQITDVGERHSFADYLGIRLITSLSSLAAAILLACWFSASAAVRLVVAAVALAKTVEAVADIYQGVFQKHERMDLLARSLFWKGGASLAAFALAYALTRSVLWSAVSMAAAQLATLALHDAPRSMSLAFFGHLPAGRGFVSPRFCRTHIDQILRGAIPLGITMMLVSLQVNIPRLAIQRRLGTGELGIFAGITCFSTAGAMIINAIGGAAVPRLSAHYWRRDKSPFRMLFRRLVFAAVLFGSLTVAASAAFGGKALRLLYGEEYASHQGLLVWIMTSAAVSYVFSMLGFAATAMGRLRQQPLILGIATAALFAACEILVPRQGLVGAAWAMLIGTLTCLAGYACLVLRRI